MIEVLKVLEVLDPTGGRRKINVNQRPVICPHCNSYRSASILGAIVTGTRDPHRDAIAVCQCASDTCRRIFTAFYTLITENGLETGRLLQNRPLEYSPPSEFSEAIRRLSPVFCSTYTQASYAEENDLSEICGARFRRSLEFLCKDFALSRVEMDHNEERTQIIRSSLSQCIDEHMPDAIRDAAHRAAWLGNDETHYYRAWSERDLRDLKALIQLTAKSIDFTLEMEHYIEIMPAPKR